MLVQGRLGVAGRQVVEQALGAGYRVTAVVRDPTRFGVRHDGLELVVGDVLDPVAIAPAVTGADAVVSALGPRSSRAPSEAVRRSGTDWTIVRPPRLVDGPLTRTYRRATDANLRRGYRISRADLADATLASLNDQDTIKKTVAVGY